MAALGRTLAAELRTPPTPLSAAETMEEAELAPSAIPLEACEATEAADPVTPEADPDIDIVMAIELEREERAPPSREEDADGALIVLDSEPETD